MNKHVSYNSDREDVVNIVEESSAAFMKSFSSQEEAESYRLQKNLSMSDMEKFQMFCRLIRIGKMLSADNISHENK
ncbi:MAG: hypothetical protein PW786_09185 [Arachidicoccus sp.]|nr:hypothetical protein [Arachidicoccus sp.]